MNSTSSVGRNPTGDDKLRQNDTPTSGSWLGRAVSWLTGKMPETLEIEKILSHNLTAHELSYVKKNLKTELKLFNEQIKNQTLNQSDVVKNFQKIFREKIAEADVALLDHDSQIRSLRPTGKAKASRLNGTSSHAKAVITAAKEAFKKIQKEAPRLKKSSDGTTIENSGHISGVQLKDTSVRNTRWIPSSQHRALAKDKKTAESSALANFRVNARLRTFECADQKIVIDQGAAIADFSDPDTNLQELTLNVNIKAERRKDHLTEQFFQRIESALLQAEQMGRKWSDLGSDNKLIILQMSLMNETRTKGHKNEESYILDNSQIFKEFEGKKIVFDGTGPKIDEVDNKIIHWPKKVVFEGITQEIELIPIFFNFSTDNGLFPKEKPIQQEINQKSLARLEAICPDHKFENVLEQSSGTCNPDQAILSIMNAVPPKGTTIALGVNCMSGKDRTQELVTKFFSTKVPEKLKSNINKVYSFFIGPGSVSLEVAYENIHARVIKLGKLLPGESLFSAIKRAIASKSIPV